MGCILKQGNKCMALKKLYCNGGKDCVFSVSAEENRIKIDEAYKRLSSLSAEQQQHIADTYYGGKYPWEGSATKNTD